MDEVFEKGGENGAILRTIDWDKHPLGPIARWPQALRTSLSIVLASPYAMAVLWGPKAILIYNDAATSIYGERHPQVLGTSFQAALPMVWEQMEPRVAEIWRTGRAFFLENAPLFIERLAGRPEECFFTFSYMPTRGEDGAIVGLVVIAAETTRQVLAERRLKILSALSQATSAAPTIEAASRGVAAVLASAPADLPFSLLYLPDEGGFRLAAWSGIAPGTPASPTHITSEATGFPVARVAETGAEALLEIDPINASLDALPGGAWPEPTTRAFLVPLGFGHERAVLIAGLSARRSADDDYRDFIRQLAAQIGAVFGNARALEEEAQRARALAELDRAKTDFFNNVSHEFRTPLALVLGPVNDALDSPTRSLSGPSLEVVGRNARRLEKLVSTLLDFSKVEAGKAQFSPRPTDLAALTTELASAFESAFARMRISLVIDCPKLAHDYPVDPEQWEKIVLNLVSNALKYSEHGEVRITLREDRGAAVFTVRDTGVGIPEDELPRIFDRFYRARSSRARSHEGTGIGLALVRELVHLHGGTIEVESEPDVGSTFTVRLPEKPAPVAHLAASPHDVAGARAHRNSRALKEPSPALRGHLAEVTQWASPPEAEESAPLRAGAEHVMVADDNADVRRYLTRLLAPSYRVTTVNDGKAALAAIRAGKPDILIADVMMPKLDGFGLLRELRADEATRDMPVMLLSARAGEESTLEGIARGADDYLHKPFSAKELLSRVAVRLEITRARREIVRAQTRLHTQMMQVPVAMSIVSGPDFTYELANARYVDLVGRSALVGRSLREVFPELQDDSPLIQMVRGVYVSGQSFTASDYCISLDKRGEGVIEDRYFDLTCQPVLDESGKTTAVLTVAIDVTDQWKDRARIESLNRELKLADQRKDEFLATLAHELRNPMAAINTALALLERDAASPARTARYRESAKRQVNNLVRLVDDLLDVARITRGKIELRKSNVDLVPVVQNAIASVRPTLEARQHTLTMEVEPGAFPVNVDATRIEQIAVNLLTNAAKYTDSGGRITVSLAREDGSAVLRVRDNGRGIPAEMLEQIFETFVQVSPTIDRKNGGLGLGLALVKSLVGMHGGAVAAHSEGAGRGSEIEVRLPLSAPLAPEASAEPAEALQASAARRILVIEDGDDVRELLQTYLASLGHEVIVASNGMEGVALMLEHRPELALVDVGLPGLDGYEVAAQVRAAGGAYRPYLMALTGYGGPEAAARSESAGFDQHLVKPVNLDLLVKLIDDVSRR